MSAEEHEHTIDEQAQQRLMISFFQEAHVSMWACDADFRIVLWNEGAASAYGRSADSVLGERYDEVFIDEAEREQSIEDCRAIIEHGTRYTNFLALDHDAHGEERQMLTNCFRITDPLTGKRYQAEVGINIADLDVAQQKLRTLRELGLRQMYEREQTLRIRRTHLELAVSTCEADVRSYAASKTAELDRVLRNVTRRLKADNSARYRARKQAITESERRALDELASMRQRIGACGTVDETLVLERELGERAAWTKRIDDAESERP